MEKIQLEQVMAEAAQFNFEDADRQEQYGKLLAKMANMVKKYGLPKIQTTIMLYRPFVEIFEAIAKLLKAEAVLKEQPWTRDECIE